MHPHGLLAVDLGLRTGLALYNRSGRLVSYRSSNFGSTTRLKSAVSAILRDAGPPAYLVLEGGGRLLAPWIREANRFGSEVIRIEAGVWRSELILSRDRRTGVDAKRSAIRLAREVIEWSGCASPATPLRDDAAEAIMVGLWGVRRVGWIDEYPSF